MTKISPEEKKRIADAGFLCGVGYAAAYLSRDEGEHSLAENLLASVGYGVGDFRKAKLDGYDMRVVSKLFRTAPSLINRP